MPEVTRAMLNRGITAYYEKAGMAGYYDPPTGLEDLLAHIYCAMCMAEGDA